MKALLRRARCYSRLNRYEEAIREYEKWQEFAAEGKRSPKSSSGSSPCWFDLPRDVTGADADMVRKELDEVRKSKRRMDAAAREAANRQNERQQWQDNMHSRSFGGTDSRPNSDAEQRREDWYDQQNDSRRWDSFSGRYPRSGGPNSSGPSNSSSAHPGPGRSRTWDHTAGTGRSNSAHSRQTVGSPGSDLSVSHYDVLGVTRHASTRDIKKAYRAKALTEHPDKNINDPHAADKFRRIQLAYEVLSESLTRHTYDVEQGFGRR
jgi:DnaJ-domain-containing protein 1